MGSRPAGFWSGFLNRKLKVGLYVVGGLVAVAAGGAWYANDMYEKALLPMREGDSFLVRYDDGISFIAAVGELADQGVIRDGRAFRLYCKRNEKEIALAIGTYEFNAGMTVEQVLAAMKSPITQTVRIPEGWWIARVAPILEENNVCSAEEYIALANDPSQFVDVVDFPLPTSSLEGYLYPDTYELAPLLGAEAVISLQLVAFEEKVWSEIEKSSDWNDSLEFQGAPPDPHTYIVMASMIELEAAVEKDRPMIAGVIANRLKANMALDMDATILYALQEWRKLEAGETRRVISPYNTYLNRGLPPGPIGSPAWRSISAAMNPAEHRYYYYYAPPGSMEHIFTKSYSEHRRAIRNPSRFMPPPLENAQP